MCLFQVIEAADWGRPSADTRDDEDQQAVDEEAITTRPLVASQRDETSSKGSTRR